MTELKLRFKKFRELNPDNGDYIIMCMTVTGQKYNKRLIQRAFKELVSDEEYDASEKVELIEYLLMLTDDEI